MHLELVEVENFRGIPKLSGTFRPGLNVVVGRNNVGKSALLDAIRLALGNSALQNENVWINREDFHVPPGASAATPPAHPIRITLQFSGASEDQFADLIELVEYNPAAPEQSKLRIHFEAIWDEKKLRAQTRRWGGAKDGDRTPIDTEILAEIPVTYLQALRDSNQALTPGNKNRLARILERRTRASEEDRKNLESIFARANDELDKQKIITDLASQLQKTAKAASGSDYVEFSLRAAQHDHQRILRTLRLLLSDGMPEIANTGLGYSNVLFMSTVLAQLESDAQEGIPPLFLIEEPEAHLHPQLTQLLAQYLAERTEETPHIQVIATSHSPTFASQVRPSQIVSMTARRNAAEVTCNHLASVGLEPREEAELQRMMDITKSTLYFAKGFLLVEGLSEALLLRELAKRAVPGYDLAQLHVSVIPISGVSFGAFQKLLSAKGVDVPVAIVTDGDPEVDEPGDWETHTPRILNGAFETCQRTKDLIDAFAASARVKVFHSKVTLEYDLAEAGDENAAHMARAWTSLFPSGRPGTFNADRLAKVATRSEKAMVAWRGMCRSSTPQQKPAFAQRLAYELKTGTFPFIVPEYLTAAIAHAASAGTPVVVPPLEPPADA